MTSSHARRDGAPSLPQHRGIHAPWCAILGDHDVHEKSFANFKEGMSEQIHYAFTLGNTRFLAINAGDIFEPPFFTVWDEQLRWAKDERYRATRHDLIKVILFDRYPSDLKVGREEVGRLIRGMTCI